MQSPERSYALDGLINVFYKGAYSGKIIDSYCKKLESPASRAFFTKLFMGTIEKSLQLDAIIKTAANRRIKDISRPVLNILRLSLFQIYYMDNVTDAAALNCAQYLCEEKKQHRAKGFVNGVLRNITRNKEQFLIDSTKNKSELEKLSLEYSIPGWITEYFRESFSIEEIKDIYKSFNGEHFLILRINPFKTDMDRAKKLLEDAGLEPKVIEGLPAFSLGNYTAASDIPGLMEGLFYVQDKSSMQAVAAIGIKPGDRIIDVCSAPGGKGLFAAGLTGTNGFVSMRDVSETKVKIIQENAHAQGITNIETKVFDARKLDEKWIEKADVVIADLPCSGLGTIGNKPEIKYRLKKDDIKSLSAFQSELLEVVHAYVKPGGRMLFSTCTMGHEENTDNVERFLNRHSEFSLIDSKTLFPDGNGSDGFFYAVFVRGMND